MVKTFAIFEDVEDPEKLLQFLVSAFPIIHKLPGVICSDVTSVTRMNSDTPQRLDSIQIMIETHVESEEAIKKFVFSQEGLDVMQKCSEITPCKISLFYGKEKRFSKELTPALKKAIEKIGYE